MLNEEVVIKVTTKTVLVVDDEDMIRESLSRIIEHRCKMNVFCASHGLQAVEMYKMLKPDCVLLDLGLPDINGLEVLERIKKADIKARVYIISAYDDTASKQKAKELGALDYLSKPISLDDLTGLLKKL